MRQLDLLSGDGPLSVTDQMGFSVTFKRSAQRRTLEIIIKEGEVQLMLPRSVSDKEGMAFVREKRDWILRTLAKQQNVLKEIPVKQYCEGELFSYLGRDYPLRLFTTTQPSVQFSNGQFYVGVRAGTPERRAAAAKNLLWKWYQERALEVLSEKSHAFAARVNRKVNEIKLRRTITKWGHCTADGVIQYNWVIIAAPEPVVNYLVAHEVSHLVYRSHGVRFWGQVEKLFPGYKSHQTWLRVNGHRLVI